MFVLVTLYTALFAIQTATKHWTIIEKNKNETTDKSVIRSILTYSQTQECIQQIKVNVARTRLPSVGFRSWSRFLAVSLQVTWVINLAVGCHYFAPCPRLPSRSVGGYQFRCLVNRGTMGVNSLPKTVTCQRRGCDLNPGPSAAESSTLTTRQPSHPWHIGLFIWTVY